MLQCDLHELDSQGRRTWQPIAAYAAAEPNEPWILGRRMVDGRVPRGCPSKDDLDAVVPDRPVFLPNRDGHSAWVNSTRARDAPA